MTSLRAHSPLRRLAAFLALLAWVGLGASLCFCAHVAPSVVALAEAPPSCHGAEAVWTEAVISSTCCQEGASAPPVVTLDLRSLKNDPPARAQSAAFAPGSPGLPPGLLPSDVRAAVGRESSQHPPPPAFVLPLRI